MSEIQVPVTPSASAPDAADKAAALAATNPPTVPPQFVKADGTVDVAGLAKAYRESQQKITAQGQALAAKPADAPAPSTLDEAFTAPAVEATPDVWAEAQKELAAEGKISEETRKTLKEKVKATDEVIAALESGHKAQQITLGARLAEAAGGVQEMNEAIAFARANMNEVQAKNLRASLEGPNGELVMAGLVAKMRISKGGTQARTTTPKSTVTSVIGESVATAPAPPFESLTEQNAVFRSPRYRVDPAYREWAAKRMAATMAASR